MVLFICDRFHENILINFNLQSGQEYMVEMLMFNVQMSITLKVGKSELRFMCSARRLIMFCICVMFRENITKGIRVMERTRVHGRNGYVQCSKGNNSVSGQTKLWFMCSKHRLMVVYV